VTPREALDWIMHGNYGRETTDEQDEKTSAAEAVLEALVTDAEGWWRL
jgi:hypothetical protein